MAVNQNHTENRRGVIVPFGESVLKQCPDVMLTFPKAPEGYDLFRGSKTGVLFLTSYRVIFVTSHTVSDPMLSFMMPFELMRDCTVEQPVFHPNFIKGTITAAPDGGWEGQATFKLSFRKGGAIEFFQLMTQAAAAASRGVPFGNTSFWFGGPAMYVVVTRDRAMACTPENPCQAIVYSSAPRRAPPTEHGASSSGYDVPPPGYGTLPSGYQAPPLGYQAPPPGYQAPPPGYQAPPPGYQVPPPGYQVPPPEYQALPPGYQVPPPGYQAPPPGYQAPPPGYQVPPPGHEAPPPGYQVPPPGHEAPPPGYRNTPPEDGAQPSRQETSLSSSSFQSSSPPPPRM